MARYHFLKLVRATLVGGLTDQQLIRPGAPVRTFPKDYISATSEITDTDGGALVAGGYAEVVTDQQALDIVAALNAPPAAPPAPDLLVGNVNGIPTAFRDPREIGPLTGAPGTRPQRISRLSGTNPPSYQDAGGPVPLPAGADDFGNGTPLATHAAEPHPPVALLVNAPSTAVHAVSFAVIVSAIDVNGNVVTGYTGTIHFTNSAGSSGLADYTFLPGDAGQHTFAAAQFAAAGLAKSISAADTVTGIHGSDAIDIT